MNHEARVKTLGFKWTMGTVYLIFDYVERRYNYFFVFDNMDHMKLKWYR